MVPDLVKSLVCNFIIFVIYIMNFVFGVIALALVISLYKFMYKENFRGRGRRGRWGRGGWGRPGFNPNRYVRRFRRRRPWFPYWNNVTIWPSSWYYAPVPCNCKRGCTPDGCAFPGWGPNDCVWASDCNCC